ncbi:MAG: hypothetical protein ACYDCL_20395 [Myxococcales bacterium]
MSLAVETGTSLAFDRFWRWLREHPNCILEAGTPECDLFDHDDLHWQLGDDEDHGQYVQLVCGKRTVGELLIDSRDVLFVQGRPDATEDEPGRHLFELIGGSPEEPYPLYRFLVAHGIEDDGNHAALKH